MSIPISDRNSAQSLSVNDAFNASKSNLKRAGEQLNSAEKAANDGDLSVQDSLKMQKAMFQMQEATALASTMMKSVHEMTMGIIQNMK
jgi:hypothetical protein